jgi:hypothetical protein
VGLLGNGGPLSLLDPLTPAACRWCDVDRVGPRHLCLSFPSLTASQGFLALVRCELARATELHHVP